MTVRIYVAVYRKYTNRLRHEIIHNLFDLHRMRKWPEGCFVVGPLFFPSGVEGLQCAKAGR